MQDPQLKVALDALVDDVVATSGLTRERAIDLVYGRAQDHLAFLYGAGQEESIPHVVAWVVEAVQDDLIEGSGDLPRAVVWPRCPAHPNHPLWFGPEFSPDSAWTCPESGRAVAALGAL
jgi:hypothetical protein